MNPFEHPEIEKLFNNLSRSLFKESGRGALLLSTTYVEEYLTILIEVVLPKNISQNHKEKLFKYPGHLSSFASKIELAYAFRLINKNLYNSLNALRKLRNDAAHKKHDFELHELNEKLKEVYSLGEGIAIFIREKSVELLLHEKVRIIEKHFQDLNLSDEELNQKAKDILTDENYLKKFEKQVPFWEMVLGLCLLCWLIINESENLSKLIADINTWSGLSKLNQSNIDEHLKM